MKMGGAAVMLQFECAKCGHFRDLWPPGSRELRWSSKRWPAERKNSPDQP